MIDLLQYRTAIGRFETLGQFLALGSCRPQADAQMKKPPEGGFSIS
jgi:hypothetical protein